MRPEIEELSGFLAAFNKESDRGAALVAAAMLDERLLSILSAYLVESSSTKDLLAGFNAPLGTFSARASAAAALGLIQDNEFKEISLIRKIRNVFGHEWGSMSFQTPEVASLAIQLPWLGPDDDQFRKDNRARFNFAVAILLTDLMWRVRLVESQKLVSRVWPNRSRGP